MDGRRRTYFQVAVALATPTALALFLARGADKVPVETLWTLMTPWLLFPFGVIALTSWYAGDQLDLEHPFRGFLIASAILGVLCWLWSMGMTTESDSDGEGSYTYLDRGRAKRAKETGKYVWLFLIYILSAYLVMLLRLRLRLRRKQAHPNS